MKNNYLLVAHPDDETLWASFLSQNLQNLKILCLTNKNNLIRLQEFKNVCNILKKEYEIFDFLDGGRVVWGPEVHKLLNKLEVNQDSIIITHSPHGEENGHPQHIQIYNAVFKNSKTRSKQAFFSDIQVRYFTYKSIEKCPEFKIYKIQINFTNIFKIIFFNIFQFNIRRPWKSVHSFINIFLYCSKIAHYKYMYEFNVDIENKHRLLENYKSQHFSNYNFFLSKKEFLYTQKKIDGINT